MAALLGIPDLVVFGVLGYAALVGVALVWLQGTYKDGPQ